MKVYTGKLGQKQRIRIGSKISDSLLILRAKLPSKAAKQIVFIAKCIRKLHDSIRFFVRVIVGSPERSVTANVSTCPCRARTIRACFTQGAIRYAHSALG